MGWMVRGLNPGVGEIFRTRPDWPWGLPSLLYNGYRVFPGVKWPGHGVDHTSPSSALWAFMTCSKVNFTFTFTLTSTYHPHSLYLHYNVRNVHVYCKYTELAIE
jgi:hypothetical protein